jgi:hypothetical protein
MLHQLRRIQPGNLYSFRYTNHVNKVETRFVTFRELQHGVSLPYYDTPRLLLNCWDHARQQHRTFDPANIDWSTFQAWHGNLPE